MEQSTSERLLEQSSDAIDSPRKSIDPSAEIAEPHLLLKENSFPRRSSLAPKILFKIPPHSSLQKAVVIDTERKIQSSPDKQHAHLRIILEKKKSLSQSMLRHSLKDDTTHVLNDVVDSELTNCTIQEAGDEYIPGGFVNLDADLEKELLNDFVDEFDEQTTRRKQQISSVHSVDLTNASRSPIELWQRARLLIALHLYQVEIYSNHTIASIRIVKHRLRTIYFVRMMIQWSLIQ